MSPEYFLKLAPFDAPPDSIIGSSSIIMNEWTPALIAEHKENLDVVLRLGKHLLSLINGVIDVSKIETGKIDAITEDFDVHDLIQKAVNKLKEDIEKKGFELIVRASHQTSHAESSADLSMINKEQAHAIGIRAYLTKPISVREMSLTMHLFLARDGESQK